MKAELFGAVATLGVAVGAFAQGTIALNNFNFPSCVDTDTTGNHYTGTFGIELWALNAATVPAGINLIPVPGSGVAAYNAMAADGFTLEATFASQAMSGGLFDSGEVTLRTIQGPRPYSRLPFGIHPPRVGPRCSAAPTQTLAPASSPFRTPSAALRDSRSFLQSLPAGIETWS